MEFESAGMHSQPDWNETESSALDYIQNKPLISTPKEEDKAPEEKIFSNDAVTLGSNANFTKRTSSTILSVGKSMEALAVTDNGDLYVKGNIYSEGGNLYTQGASIFISLEVNNFKNCLAYKEVNTELSTTLWHDAYFTELDDGTEVLKFRPYTGLGDLYINSSAIVTNENKGDKEVNTVVDLD
jgi:hypothetical protein